MPEIENELPKVDYERSYEQIRTIGMSLRKKGDAYDWMMGDLALELTDRADRAKERYQLADKKEDGLAQDDVDLKDGGKRAINRLCRDLAMPTEQMQKKRLVSRMFPPGHRARTLKLSYCMVREIAFVADQEKREAYLTKATEGMTVEAVSQMIASDRDKDAASKGLLQCLQCREKINDAEVMVKIMTHGTKYIFDTKRCAALWLYEQIEQDSGGNLEDEMNETLTAEDFAAV